MEKDERRWAKMGAWEGEVALWNSAEASTDEKIRSSVMYINVWHAEKKPDLA